MLYFDGITNSFLGGLFRYVRDVQLVDERPFEHTFFLSIAQTFPSLECLRVKNFEPQICKDDQDNMNNNDLLHTRTCFSNPILLFIGYNTIQRVTHNFTRDATRVNCEMVERFFMCGKSNAPEHFKLHFPRVK